MRQSREEKHIDTIYKVILKSISEVNPEPDNLHEDILIEHICRLDDRKIYLNGN